MKWINEKHAEYITVLILAALASFLFSILQPQIQISEGLGWDGVHYGRLFDLFHTGHSAQAQYPFCNRVGTVYLAYLTGIQSPTEAFLLVNRLFSVAFCCFCYMICRQAGLNRYYSLLGFALTVIPFFAPLRFVPFYPVYADPAFMALLALSFLLLIKSQYALSFALITISHLFREVGLYLLLLFYLYSVFIKGFDRKNLYYFIGNFVLVLVIKFLIANQFNCHGSQIKTALEWAFMRISNPDMFLRYCAAIMMTAAPVIFIRTNDIKTDIEKLSIAGFTFAAIMAFLGGADATRIFYGFLPIYLILIVSVIRTQGIMFSLFCMLAYIITNRFGQKILEPLNDWPNRDVSGFFYQFPDHAMPEVSLIIIAVWAIMFFLYRMVSRILIPGYTFKN